MGPRFGGRVSKIDETIAEARDLTSSLRVSGDDYWPALRNLFQDRGIDPLRAAIGDMFPDQGLFMIVVSGDGKAFAALIGSDPRNQSAYRMSHWEELDSPEKRRQRWIPIHAALMLLNEESPGSVDPTGVLVEAVEDRTHAMRDDVGANWSRFRSFLLEKGVDPARTLLLRWHELPSRDRPTQRIGTVLFEGRWFSFTASVNAPLGSIAKVTSWKEIDETSARRAHGGEVDAALRLVDLAS